jgi:hypothetical protein
LDFSFSLGELTANPFIIGLENQAAGATTRAAQNIRIETLVSAMRLRANKLSAQGNVDDIAVDMNKTIIDANKRLQQRASQNYDDGLANIIDNFGDDVVIDGRHYLSETQRLLAEYADPTLGGSKPPQFLVNQIKELDRKVYPATVVREVGENGQVTGFAVRRKDDNLLIGRFERAPEAAAR